MNRSQRGANSRIRDGNTELSAGVFARREVRANSLGEEHVSQAFDHRISAGPCRFRFICQQPKRHSNPHVPAIFVSL
jgi:hypothetical protein